MDPYAAAGLKGPWGQEPLAAQLPVLQASQRRPSRVRCRNAVAEGHPQEQALRRSSGRYPI